MTWEVIEHFSPHEFKCRCGNCGSDGKEMDMRFIARLDALRKEFGTPMSITSGYRCPIHNNHVSSTGLRGPHTTGRAADVGISGADAWLLVLLSNFGGIGINQRGPYNKRFIHFDDLEGHAHPRPRIWTY